jgi:hypothetical protein
MPRSPEGQKNSKKPQYHEGPLLKPANRPERVADVLRPDISSLNTAEPAVKTQSPVLLGDVVKAMLGL